MFGDILKTKANAYLREMVVLQYYNLLIKKNNGLHVEVIGEQADASDATNEAIQSMTAAEIDAYNVTLATIQSMTFKYRDVSRLPTGSAFTSLHTLNLADCKYITTLSDTWNPADTLSTLDVSNTSIASIPGAFQSSLQDLSVEGCRHITSVTAGANMLTLNVSHSTVVEILTASALQRLFAVNSRLLSVSMPTLETMMWSSSLDAVLNVQSTCTGLKTIVTDKLSEVNIDVSLNNVYLQTFEHLS